MRKVNLGAGGNLLDGWDNYDLDVPIDKTLPWPDGSVDMMLAEHVVEHVPPAAALRFFFESHRVLVKNGILRVCIPVLDHLGTEHACDIIMGHGHQAAYNSDLVRTMLHLAGFANVRDTGRATIDGHWREIGEDKDFIETFRVEATK